jgi:hypothetical protein
MVVRSTAKTYNSAQFAYRVACIARMQRSEIRDGIDASWQSRITALRPGYVFERSCKNCLLQIFSEIPDRFSVLVGSRGEVVAIQYFTATRPLLQ